MDDERQRLELDAEGGGAVDGSDAVTDQPGAARPGAPEWFRGAPPAGVAPRAVPEHDAPEYELLGIAGDGAGGEGTTFRARWTPRRGLAITCAVKALRRPEGAGDGWPRGDAQRELEEICGLLRALPQNCHLGRVGTPFVGRLRATSPVRMTLALDVERLFVVMDWVEGKPPTPAVVHAAALSDRLGWVAGLCSALAQLHTLAPHGNAPVHGDVKPSNCLITASGDLVLIDFGAAAHVLTRAAPGGWATRQYAAPEVVTDPWAARQPASDLFALALTAVELLGGAPPDRTDLAGRAQQARSDCRRLLAPLPRALCEQLTNEVVGWLEGDPARRPVPDPAPWWRAARRMQSQNRWQRRALPVGAAVTAAAAAAVAVAVSGAGTGTDPAGQGTPEPSASPEVTDAAARTIRWDLLAQEEPAPADLTTYRASFPDQAGAWAAEADTPDLVQVTGDGLELHAPEPGFAAMAPAPGVVGNREEVVSATGVIEQGQGTWGPWCRGTSDGMLTRYVFSFSHADAVEITEQGVGEDGTPFRIGTGFWWLEGIDTSDGVAVEGRCLDDSRGVLLEMLVNGRVVLEYRPEVQLGPGSVGLEAAPFSDVGGERLVARVTQFSDARPT